MTGTPTTLGPEDKAALDGMAGAMSENGSVAADYRLLGRRQHRGSINLVVELSADEAKRQLFVKRLRNHAEARYRLAQNGGDRPRLKAVPDPTTRLANEAIALEAIQQVVEQADRPDWFAVPVVPVPDCPGVLVLERILTPTFAEQVERGAPPPMLDAAAQSLGALLHAIHHRLPELPHSRPHLSRATEIVEIVGAMIDQIDDRRLRRRRGQIVQAIETLPPTLGIAPSHGDFAAQNVFLTDQGAVAVFDTSVDLTLPVHFDLAYFGVMLEFAGHKRLKSRGVDNSIRLCEQLRVGYGPDVPPRSEQIAFELALLLDRWCSLSERRGSNSIVPVMARWARRQVLAARLHQGITRRLDELAGNA